MKKLLLGLFIFCFSSEAYAIKVEDMYKLCKPYHTSGYTVEDKDATICMGYMKGLIDAGAKVCGSISIHLCYEKDKLCSYDNRNSFEIYLTHLHKLKHANNRNANLNDVIQSFIHYVEKYYRKWDKEKKNKYKNVADIKEYFLHREFECKKYAY